MSAGNTVTKGILIGVIAFTAGGALMAGIVSVWDRAAAVALGPIVARFCEGGDPPAPRHYAFAASGPQAPHGVGTVWQPRLATADLPPEPSLGARAVNAFRTVFSCTPRSTPS